MITVQTSSVKNCNSETTQYRQTNVIVQKCNGQNVIEQIDQQSDNIRQKYNIEQQIGNQNYNSEKPKNRWTSWDKNTITKHHRTKDMQASLQKIYNNQIIIERQKNKQTDKNTIVQNVIDQIDVIRDKYNIETSYNNRQASFEKHTIAKMSQNNIQTLTDKITIV